MRLRTEYVIDTLAKEVSLYNIISANNKLLTVCFEYRLKIQL